MVRSQVEEFQRENHCRFLFYSTLVTLIGAFLVWQVVFAHFWFPRLFCSGFVALLFYTARQHHLRSVSRAIPEGASLPDLVALYRRELARRRDFLRTLWYWKMAPLAAPVLIMIAVKQNSKSMSTAIWTLAIYALTNIAARKQAREIQRQIDELGAQGYSDDSVKSF